MIGIDPEKVSIAGQHLRQNVTTLDDIEFDIRAALTRSGLVSQVLTTTGDVDFELTSLDSILRARAALASGLHLRFALTLTNPISELWNHLLDPEGANAALVGDAAVTLVLDSFGEGDTDLNGLLDTAELERMRTEGHNQAVRQSAAYLLRNPRLVDEINGSAHSMVAATELRQFLVINAEIRAQAELAARMQIAGNDDAHFEFSNGWDPSPAQLLTAAINRQAYVDEPVLAQAFIATLPGAGQPTLPLVNIHGEGLQALHQSALSGVPANDLRTRADLIMFMPESSDGYRNQRITHFYALLAILTDNLVNPDTMNMAAYFAMKHASYSGANWLHFGSSAAFSVGPTIRGEQRSFAKQVPDVIRQQFADGNQIIFSSVVPHYLDLLELFGDGEVTEERVTVLLSSFEDGEQELQQGFAAQLGAMSTEDPVLRRQFQWQSNALIGVHEQAIINDLLDMGSMEGWERGGAHVASGLAAELKSPFASPYLPPGIAALTQHRNAEQIATDDGELVIPLRRNQDGQIVGPAVPIGEALPVKPLPVESLSGLDLLDEFNPANVTLDDFGLPLADLPPLTSAAEGQDFTIDYRDWLAHNPDGIVDEWASYPDRMVFIPNLMLRNQFNPDLITSVEFISQEFGN